MKEGLSRCGDGGMAGGDDTGRHPLSRALLVLLYGSGIVILYDHCRHVWQAMDSPSYTPLPAWRPEMKRVKTMNDMKESSDQAMQGAGAGDAAACAHHNDAGQDEVMRDDAGQAEARQVEARQAEGCASAGPGSAPGTGSISGHFTGHHHFVDNDGMGEYGRMDVC